MKLIPKGPVHRTSGIRNSEKLVLYTECFIYRTFHIHFVRCTRFALNTGASYTGQTSYTRASHSGKNSQKLFSFTECFLYRTFWSRLCTRFWCTMQTCPIHLSTALYRVWCVPDVQCTRTDCPYKVLTTNLNSIKYVGS